MQRSIDKIIAALVIGMSTPALAGAKIDFALYEGPPRIVQGEGGAKITKNGIDYWTIGTPRTDLANVVQTMMDTGVVSQSDVDAMRQAAGPGKDVQLAELLRANNIRIMPNEGMPGARNAVYNPDEGAASLQEAQYDPSMYETARGKPPMQSPMPGSAQVPLPRVRGEAEAGEAGKQGVRVATEPKIAAGTARAERLEKLRGDMPKAWNALAARFADMGRRVADIDYILARPQALEGITGPLEGRLTEYANIIRPGGERYQDVQSRINKVKATQLGAMAGLDQAQSRPAFESALRSLRSVYNEMGTQLPDAFNKTFAEVMEPKDRLGRFGYPIPGVTQIKQPWWGEVVRTGRTRDGRLVRQYSNGEIEYVRP